MSLTSTARSNHRSNSFELPYGYEIDLDFIKYCEGLTKPILTDNGLLSKRHHQRRQRQSIEVMLGLEKSFASTIEDLKQMDVFRARSPTPPAPPPRSHVRLMNLHRLQQPSNNSAIYLDQSDLEDAVNDFEKTFENSHYQKNQQILNANGEDGCISPNKSPQELPESSKYSTKRCNGGGSAAAILPEANNIRKILNHVEDLEERTKLIPLLQLQVQKLKLERDQLQQILLETKKNVQEKQNPPAAAFQPPQRVSPVALSPLTIVPPRRMHRSVHTSTVPTVVRDVGVSPAVLQKVNRGIETDISVKVVSDGSSDKLYTERELRSAIENDRMKSKKATSSVAVQHDLISPPEPPKEVKTKTINLNKSELKAVSIPSTTAPADDVQSSSTLSLSNLLKETKKEKSTQHSVQSVEKCTQHSVQSIDRSTDMRDLHKPKVNKSSTTSDLIRFNQVGVNTDAPPITPLRTISTNTSTTIMRSVGTSTDEELMEIYIAEKSASTVQQEDKISTHSPTKPENRHYKRQDTFTVSRIPVASSLLTNIAECPAEKLLRLTMTSSNGQEENPPSSSIEETENVIKNNASSSKPEDSSADVDNNKEDTSIEEEEEQDALPIVACDILHPEVPSSDALLAEYKEEQGLSEEEHESGDDEVEEDDDLDDYEEEEDKFDDEDLQFVNSVRPPPTSISTIRLCQQNRPRIKPSREMMSALKVIDDTLKKDDFKESDIKNAREIAACEWFQFSSTKDTKSNNIEDYLDYFEEQSWELLTYMVNLADKNGNTALHYSVSHKNFDAVSILLDSKVCDVNKTNNAGYTCVMLVSLAKELIAEHQTVVKRLFKLSDVNIRASKNQQTALMLSVSHGNFLITTLLVEAGADINIQDDDGSTALMCAAEHGFGDIVKYLLAQPECDSTIQDIDGNTALKIALESGYHDTGCLLYAHEHILRNKQPLKRTSSIRSSTGSLNNTQR